MIPQHAFFCALLSTVLFVKFGYTLFRIYQVGFFDYFTYHYKKELHGVQYSYDDFCTYFRSLWVFCVATGFAMVVFWSFYVINPQ